jgi:hypothetical protein
MDGVTDVPASPRAETSSVSIEPPAVDLWSAFAPLFFVAAIFIVNLAAYGVAWTMNPQSDLLDPVRIALTTVVVAVLAVIIFVTIVSIKTGDNAVPPPLVARQGRWRQR